MVPKTRSGNRGNVTKKDFVALLPKEIVMSVLGYLEPSDLLKAAQTSKVWRKQAEDDLLWKNKCEKADLTYCLNSENEDTLKRLSRKTSFLYSFWKASFLKPYKIEKNFRTKKPEVTKVQKCHFTEGFYLLLSVVNNLIVSSSSNAMYMLCASTGKTLHTLVGHTGPVRAIQVNNDFVISGSWDKCLRVWDIDKGEGVHILQGHAGPVLCLHLHAGIVVSGSLDATLRMWDVQGGQLLRTLTGHVEGVACVQLTGNLVVSGSYDGMVKVWDPETGECLRALTSHTALWSQPIATSPLCTGGIYSLKVDGDLVVSSDQFITKIWKVNTGVLQNTLYNYRGDNLDVKENVLVGFSRLESKCKIWNILTSSCLQTLDSGAIASIQFNNKFVVIGQFDGKVKLWDLKTGEFIRDLFWLESGGKVWKIWLEETKIVCAVQMLRLDNLKKIEMFVLNLDRNDVK